MAQAGKPLDLFLFDSGTDQVYRATCAEIHWNKTGDPDPSPEPELTPQYYRDRKFRLWFKLTSIGADALAPDALRGWTCVRVDEFFRSGESPYSAFYGKRVFDAPELRPQGGS